MIRTALTVGSVAAVVLGIGIAVAQQDVIKERKDLMKANGQQAKVAADMIKGVRPFDLAAAQKIFAAFTDAAAKMPDLYPAGSQSETGSPSADDFSPTAKVWENMADFKARFVKFGQDAKAAAASVKDLDSFKAAMANIGKTDCGACHQIYRVQKKS